MYSSYCEDMFCVQSINDETNFYPHETIRSVPNDSGEMQEQVFYSKTRQPRERVEYEAGFDDYNPSLKEVLDFMLIRLAGRFTKEELPYFCDELNRNPVYDIDEGRDGVYKSSTAIRSLMARWKKEHQEGSTPLTVEEIADLEEKLLHAGIAQTTELSNKLHMTPSPTGAEICHLLQMYESGPKVVPRGLGVLEAVFNAIPYETGMKRELPHVIGIMSSGTDIKLCDVTAVMVDTGASVSLVNLHDFPSLGLRTEMIDRSLRPDVATAAKGVIKSEGYIHTRLHLRNHEGKYPYIKASFLVIPSDSMAGVMLGHGELVDNRYQIGFDDNRPETGYALQIAAYAENQKRPSRQIIPIIEPRSVKMVNVNHVSLVSPGEPQMIRFRAADCPLATPSDKFVLTANDERVQVPEQGQTASLSPEQRVIVGEDGPSHVESDFTVPIYDCQTTFPPGKLELFLSEVRGQAPVSLSEMDLYDLENVLNKEGVSWDQNEAYIMSHISQYPEYFEPPEGGVILPELKHLPVEWRAKFDQLFRANIDCLSQHQFDIGQCTLPPVSIQTAPGVTSQDKPRNYKPGEKKILRDYLKDLLEAGIVKKVDKEPSWNHNINLVPKSVDGSQKLDRSGHGMTRQQQLETCGVRFCSDLRGVNEAIPHEQMTQLPQFDVMCPLLSAKKLCLFDIRSGYFSVLLDEKSQDIFGFQVDNEYYVYTRLVQGFKNSVAIFQNLMHIVFNEKAWDKYRENIPCLANLNFQDTFSIYVDDLAVAAYTLEQLFYCTEFAMMCIKRAGLKFHPKKICIDQTIAEVLGFEINTLHSTYKIASKRAAAILQWAFPNNRNAIKSRIASLQYFARCLPGIKHLVFGLTLLAKTKDNKIMFRKLHKLEFMAMRLLVSMQIEMHLPQLDKPLYVSSDASFSTYAGVIMQRQEVLDENRKPTGQQEMVVCGAMSKNFKQGDLQRAIYQKETQAMVQTLKSFNYWIRAAVKTIFSTDCIFLAHIANLRHQDSKMFATALFLSTFGNVYFVHSRGSHFLVALADILSRGLGGSEILSAAGIPKEYLEDRSKFGDPAGMIVSPQTLHNVMTAPCPNYTNVPYRKEQRPCPDMLEFDEDHIFNNPTPEAEVITAMFGGYESIRPDTIAFKNPETQKKMSKTDFIKLEKKYNLQNIRNFVEQAKTHQKCETTNKEEVNNTMIFDQDKDFAEEMVRQLKEFLQAEEKTEENTQILGLCYSYLGHQERSYSVLRDIIKAFQNSSYYADSEVRFSAVRYILAEQAKSSEVELRPEPAAIAICASKDIIIDTESIVKIRAWVKFATRYELEFVETLPQVAIMANQTDGAIHTWIHNLVLFYDGSQSKTIPAGTKLGELRFHGDGPKCSCSIPLEKGLLLDEVEDTTFYAEDKAAEALDSRIMLFNCMTAVTEPMLDRPIAQTVIGENMGSVLYPVPTDTAVPLSPNRRELNHILLLSGLIASGKVLSKEMILQFQQSCNFLSDRRLAMQRGKDKTFVEIDGILYKKKTVLGEETLLLCLDGVTFGFLASALHQKGYHFSNKVFGAYLGSLFFTAHAADAIKHAQSNCSACFFTRRCLRKKSVVANNTKPPLGARWSSDLIENLERDKNGFKYLCLLIETRTTFCLTIPLKTTQSKEFAQKLEPYLPVMMASELVTDFGTLYRGPELRELLARYNIAHNKSVPQRPQQNGLSEVTAKEVREFFRAFLQGLPAEVRARWSAHLYFATTMYNCGIIYAGEQQLTRYNLFHNANRSVNSQFLTTLNGISEQNIILQTESQKLIDQRREKAREQYNSSGLKPFEIGQLVMLVSNKTEMQKNSPSAGLEANSGKMYRVLGTTDSGLGVHCESLLNGDQQTFENAKLAPVDSDMLITGFGFDPVATGSFSTSLFKRGKGNMILQALKNNHEDLFPPVFYESVEVAMDVDEESVAAGEPEGEDMEVDPTEQTATVENFTQHDTSPDEYAADVVHRRRYDLRPRPERSYCVTLKSGGILKNKYKRGRKQVSKSLQVHFKKTVVIHPYLAEQKEEADLRSKSTDWRLTELADLPAFRLDVPEVNLLYDLDHPVRWTSSGVQLVD